MLENQEKLSLLGQLIATIIIEDNDTWQTILQKLVESKNELSCLGVFSNLEEAEVEIKKGNVELILLDVEVQGQNAIEFIKKFDKQIPVIIISSHEKYALSGYSINAIDFLVKPIDFDSFNNAIMKASTLILGEKGAYKKNNYLFNTDYLLIKNDSVISKIKYNEILYIAALQNYIRIFTTTKTHIVLTTLLHFEQNINEHPFLRVHRSFAVNMDAIKYIEKDEIVLTNDIKVPIGGNYRELINEVFVKGKILKR